MAFRVVEIIDGNTIKVSPQWVWAEGKGSEVRINGYNLVSSGENAKSLEIIRGIMAKQRLNDLLMVGGGVFVELKNVTDIEVPNQRIKCDVYLKGVNLSSYFPEYQQTQPK